jgi:hypothetical protein
MGRRAGCLPVPCSFCRSLEWFNLEDGEEIRTMSPVVVAPTHNEAKNLLKLMGQAMALPGFQAGR